ncbi:site-specific DNA-methyltransferase [Malacoplasma penetrans]|nr:site-specific DNA-methyltransferase [Malacoplasma penetrans]RXY97265.1 site-specific DNA-methyltransferase [Malacoplasma penetrans]
MGTPPYNTDASYNEKNNLLEEEVLSKKSNKFSYRDKFSRSGWLNMMSERLKKAKQLLKDDGIIFISIDDNEQAYLKVLMDDIFGEDNFISNIVWDKRNAQNDNKYIEKNHEYILAYSKNWKNFKINQVFEINKKKGQLIQMTIGANEDGLLVNRKNMGWTLYFNPATNEKIPLMDYDPKKVERDSTIENLYKDDKEIIDKGFVPIRPPIKNGVLLRWSWSFDKAIERIEKIIPKMTKNGYSLFYADEKEYKQVSHKSIVRFNINQSIIDNISSSKGSNTLRKLGIEFPNPKPVELIKFLINKHSNENAIILDFFAGSGTTGHAVMELNSDPKTKGNRKFILCTNEERTKQDINKTIAKDICFERLYCLIKNIKTSGESFNNLSVDELKKYQDVSLKTFNINYADVSINSNIDKLLEEIKKSMRLIHRDFDINNESIIKQLYSLFTLEKENN